MASPPRPLGAKRNQIAKTKGRQAGSYIQSSFLTANDGVRLFAHVEGPRAAKPPSQEPAMIFCYGIICSSLHWTYQIDHFSRRHLSAYVDYRGHQESGSPPSLKGLSLSDLSNDLAALMNFLENEHGVSEAVFLGHSMGVNVVLDYYRKFPDKVRGLVLCNGTPRSPLETLLKTSLTRFPIALATKFYENNPSILKKLWKAQDKIPLSKLVVGFGGFNLHWSSMKDVETYVSQFSKMDPGVFLYLMNSYQSYDATPWLHTIEKPTLVISGERDRITPRAQQELMAQLIPNCQFESIPLGSHCSQMDRPGLVNRLIERFLKTTS